MRSQQEILMLTRKSQVLHKVGYVWMLSCMSGKHPVHDVNSFASFLTHRYVRVEYNCSTSFDVTISTRAVVIHWSSERHMQLSLHFVMGEEKHSSSGLTNDMGVSMGIRTLTLLPPTIKVCEPEWVRCNYWRPVFRQIRMNVR